MVALSLPLPLRDEATNELLREAGFGSEDVLEIMSENAASLEWGEVSPHFQAVLAAYQEDQWASVDFAVGVVTCTVGTVAGVPLA